MVKAVHYIDVRAAQGFNVIHFVIHFVAHEDLPGQINEGGPGFFNYDSEEINPAFWQEVDRRVEYLNRKGITAGMLIVWGNTTWRSFPSDDAMLRYAKYCTARYAAYNMYFVVSGEYNEALSEEQVNAIGSMIYDNNPEKRMIGVHSTNTSEVFADEPWCSFGDYMQNSIGNWHEEILDSYDHNKPVVNSEYGYWEKDKKTGAVHDLYSMRTRTWDILMAGGYFVTGFGSTYRGGTIDSSLFNVDAPENDPFEEDLAHMKNFFGSLKWWALKPADFLLEGEGTHYCLADTGKQHIVYVRENSGTNILSLGADEPKTYTVKRYDPRTGTYTLLDDYSR